MGNLYFGREVHRDDIALFNEALVLSAEKIGFEALTMPQEFAIPVIGNTLLRTIVAAKRAHSASIHTFESVLADPVFTTPTGVTIDSVGERGVHKSLPNIHDRRIAYEVGNKNPAIGLEQVTKYSLQLAYNPRTRDKTDWLVRAIDPKGLFADRYPRPKRIDIGYTTDTDPEKRSRDTKELLDILKDAVPHIRLGILAPLSYPN